MSTSSILSALYFFDMCVHDIMHSGWAAGGVKAQMSYILLALLGVFGML